MTRTTLSGLKIAIMVANGFDETNFINMQKMLLAQNANLKVIAPNLGLVHGRNGIQAGMSYPVDAQFSETLAIDYDALIIPSGDPHLSILKEELHASRIIRAFMRENMPVLVQNSGLDLICEIDNSIDRENFKITGEIGQYERLIWISQDCAMGEASRKFVEICLAEPSKTDKDADDSAAA